MTFRVVQWTTGNVGRQSVEAIVAHPDLELVGCFAWSPDKAGRDVGELCGIAPTGVLATADVDALLGLKPDCVVYNPMWPDIDEIVRILESGANIVSTAAFITGHSLGDGRRRIAEACARGQSSIFGSGINPGFADLVAIVSASCCDRVDKVVVTETADISGYDSPATELPVGFGRPMDDPELPRMTASATAVFEDAVRLLGDALGVEFDEVVCEAEYARTTQDVDLGSWQIAANHVAGIAISWQGRIGGRTIVDLRVRWRKGQTLDPDWEINTGYVIEVQGRPTIRTQIDIAPPADFEWKTLGDFMVLGMVMTALPALNAIPGVVAAAPGIVTYTDLPLPLPRGRVRI
ncbi:NAD(P)H-dependent amine dehydrogenase family protein [Pseudofrankia inefficax]|uniref:Dihydrodipicolinate reductase n=1 Tax=Pseudofrankia inefficax (strain DSM 45817 / CECT 9037 / DDB 130130 / EuI1c) TaxID=298654 RepID=E3J3R6_PSEI1|nr:dihydrodipicolinate reductase [Pseudofrankia inefficax]ADP79403.1 dihydrodipicolinate reductase [Pseudofrankia inefficax]